MTELHSREPCSPVVKRTSGCVCSVCYHVGDKLLSSDKVDEVNKIATTCSNMPADFINLVTR
jgi:hypothetical protein